MQKPVWNYNPISTSTIHFRLHRLYLWAAVRMIYLVKGLTTMETMDVGHTDPERAPRGTQVLISQTFPLRILSNILNVWVSIRTFTIQIIFLLALEVEVWGGGTFMATFWSFSHCFKSGHLTYIVLDRCFCYVF
jgi:hypothetical protein